MRKTPQCSHIKFSMFEHQKNKILLFNHYFAQFAPAKSRSPVFLSSFPCHVPLSFTRTLLYCDRQGFFKHTFTKADVCACKAYLSFFQDQHAWYKQSKLVKISRSLTRYKLFQFKKLMLFQVSSTLKCKYVKLHCLALMWKVISYLTIYLKMLVLLSMKNLTSHYCLIFTPRTYIKNWRYFSFASRARFLQQIIISIWRGKLNRKFLKEFFTLLRSASPTSCKNLGKKFPA